MTLDDLAARLGTSRKQVTRWEGDENFPGPDYRAALTRELNLPADFFPDEPPREARLERRVAALEDAVTRIEHQLFGSGVAQVP